MIADLHLVLKFEWYDRILLGVKDVEYRRMNAHWEKRIWDRRADIKSVKLSRGYTRFSIIKEVICIDIGRCPYKGWDDKYYRLRLGRCLR